MIGLAVFVLNLIPAGRANAQAVVNNDPGFLKVYVSNIENLSPADDPLCPLDWDDLIYYMEIQEYLPDLFLVQQVSNRKQANDLADFMTQKLGAPYAAKIALNNPAKTNSPCGAAKQRQTNAIIYRTDRLRFNKKSIWQAYRMPKSKCILNNQARTRSVRARFTDVVAGKRVTAGSIYWPSGRSDGPPCGVRNIDKTDDKVTASGYSADLYIVAGDTNTKDLETEDPESAWVAWYERANGALAGELGYRDVIYDYCRETSTTGAQIEINQCLLDSWTFESPTSGNHRRIDYLLAKTPGGMADVHAGHTIQFDEAGLAAEQVTGEPDDPLPYSEHKAVHARVSY